MATATYTKLRDGSWGIRVKGTVTAGQTVTVQKKDGSSKTETVRAVLWSGDGTTIASVVATDRPRSTGSRSGGYSSEYCGGICPVGGHRCCAREGPCHDCQ